MKIPHFYLFVSLLCLSALACTIVTVTDSSAPSALANAPEILPTQTANALPTPADCLKVQSLPSGGGSLNLRAGPGTGYAVRDVLADGQTLTKRGEAVLEGDIHPFMANLQYFKDVLALPRQYAKVAA